MRKLTRAERNGISEMFRKQGRKGGIARAAKLSPEELSAAGLKAARWHRQKEAKAHA
jgi:hypothetical protein